MKKIILAFVAFLPVLAFSQIKIDDIIYPTLTDAVEAAVDGDVIKIAGEINFETVYGIKKNITLKGVTRNAKIKFGKGDARLGFEGDGTYIVVENLTLVGYPRSQRQMWTGGSCMVVFRNDTIRDCWNTGPNDEHGGAFLVTGTSTIEAYNTVFRDNKCSKNGGVFWVVDQANISLYNCLFTGNIAQFENEDGKGGVLASVGTPHEFYAENCAFIENGSEGNGGAIWIEHDVRMKCVNCTFSRNWAKGNGGAIGFWQDAGIDLINCTLYGNSVNNPGSGGAIYFNWSSNTVDMKNTVITANGYDDGAGASGASNIEGNAENGPFGITANNSYYTPTEGITVTGANNINTGAVFLNEVDLKKEIYWNSIAVETSALVGLGKPSYLASYTNTDQRGWTRANMSSAICAGAYDKDATVYDSVVVKNPIPDQFMDNSTDKISVSYDGVMGVYLIPSSDIKGVVIYDKEILVSDPAALKVVLNETNKTLDITKTTEEMTDVSVTLLGSSPLNAYTTLVFNVFLNQNTSIRPAIIKYIPVYPNPASGTIFLQGTFNSDIMVSLYNLTGENVLNSKLDYQVKKLDVSSLKPGVYLLRVLERNGTMYLQRFIKE